MSRYAQNTSVPSERSRAEIERTLSRYGATGFMYGWNANQAVVGFTAFGRQVKFHLPMPDRSSEEFTLTETGRERSAPQAEKAYDQAVRQRWRALSLVIKAKLEAVESGITEFDEEFMAHIVLPDGKTVGNHLLGQIADSYDSGQMPALLPGPKQ